MDKGERYHLVACTDDLRLVIIKSEEPRMRVLRQQKKSLLSNL